MKENVSGFFSEHSVYQPQNSVYQNTVYDKIILLFSEQWEVCNLLKYVINDEMSW